MKTKEEIIGEISNIIADDSVKDGAVIPLISVGILEAFLDIRDLLVPIAAAMNRPSILVEKEKDDNHRNG